MKIHHVPIASDALLTAVAVRLDAADRAAAEATVTRVPGWDPFALWDLFTLDPPRDPPDMALDFCCAHLADAQREFATSMPDDFGVRAVLYYPRGGGMGWHTNKGRQGWRVYVPRLFDEGDSGMLTPAGFVRDRPGFANLFLIDEGDTRHAVVARSPRMSAGFWLAHDNLRVKRWLSSQRSPC